MLRGSEQARRICVMSTAIAMGLVTMGHNGGCHADDGPTLRSPPHAVAMVLARADGGVEASLHVFSTAVQPAIALDALATAPVVRIASQSAMPADIADHVMEPFDGGYRTFLPEGGDGTYHIHFDVDETSAALGNAVTGSRSMTQHGPSMRPDAWLLDEPADGDLGVAWHPAGMAAIAFVHDDKGAVLHRSFDPRRNDITRADWRGLPTGGVIVIPKDVIAGPGTYAIEICIVETTADDADSPAVAGAPGASPTHLLDGDGLQGLGWRSGMLVGSCTSLWLST